MSERAGHSSARASGLPTVHDVARSAGVSAITVSRALRQPALVRPGTRARVDAAVRKLGYVGNAMAGSLAGAVSSVVPVVVPSLTNAFFTATLEAISSPLIEARMQLLVGVHGYDKQREAEQVRGFLPWRPAALVLVGTEHDPALAALLRGQSIPIVETWDLTDRPLDMLVGFSHEAVGRAAARHLLDCGYRRIGSIGTYLSHDRRAAKRLAGFKQQLAAAGLDAIAVELDAPPTVGAGAEGLQRLLGLAPQCEAVFCANDILAFGALIHCRRNGIAIPDRLGLIGFGGLPLGEYAEPALTTIRPPGAAIGREAAALIAERIRSGARLPKTRRVRDLGFELIARGTTTLARKHSGSRGKIHR